MGNSSQKTKTRQDEKRAIESVVRVCTGVQRLLSHAFLLAVCLFYFFTFSSLEFVNS